jgi:hypothetical protein
VEPWPHNQPLSAAAVEERMKAEGLSLYRWSNGPGDVYPAHDYTYHKVIYVFRGDITFDLPTGIIHDAIVGEHGVVCLENHR